MDYSQLKSAIPLYPDLSVLVLEYLEPCLDYSVPKCPHAKAFCPCGNEYEFRQSWFTQGEKTLLEKFCPLCGTENPHKTTSLQDPLFLVRTKKNLACPQCKKHAASYGHKFCSGCKHELAWI